MALRCLGFVLTGVTCLGWVAIARAATPANYPSRMAGLTLTAPALSSGKTDWLAEAGSGQPRASTDKAKAKAGKASLPWWHYGLLAAGAVVLGGGMFYLGRRSGQAVALALPEEAGATPSPLLVESDRPSEPAASTAAALAETNGDSVVSLAVNGTGGNLPVLQEPTGLAVTDDLPALSETTRLARIGIVEEMIQELRLPDASKRQKAIWELGRLGDTRAVQPLVDLLLDSDSRQRSLILSALAEIGTRTLKPMSRALAISLQDESPEVRKNAIRDLTRLYDLVAQISQLLYQAGDDPDGEVQETARWAAAQLGRIRGTSGELRPVLKNANSMSSPEQVPE